MYFCSANIDTNINIKKRVSVVGWSICQRYWVPTAERDIHLPDFFSYLKNVFVFKVINKALKK